MTPETKHYPALAVLLARITEVDLRSIGELQYVLTKARTELAIAERNAQPAPCGVKGHTAASVINDTCIFCSQKKEIDFLRDAVKELEQRREQLQEWKRAIEGLTPGGSEFVDDPKVCVAYIRGRTEYPRMIIEQRALLAELAGALEHAYEHVSLEETATREQSDSYYEMLKKVAAVSAKAKANILSQGVIP